MEPVSYGAVLDGELVFVPGEIPRRGVFAHWGRGTGSAKVELVFPGGTYGIRKRLMSADSSRSPRRCRRCSRSRQVS